MCHWSWDEKSHGVHLPFDFTCPGPTAGPPHRWGVSSLEWITRVGPSKSPPMTYRFKRPQVNFLLGKIWKCNRTTWLVHGKSMSWFCSTPFVYDTSLPSKGSKRSYCPLSCRWQLVPGVWEAALAKNEQLITEKISTSGLSPRANKGWPSKKRGKILGQRP